MQMKKNIVLIAMLMLLTSLSACGNTSEPYLNVEDRNAVADALFGSLDVEGSSYSTSNYFHIAVRNTTKYDLADVRVKLSGFSNALFPTVPAGVRANTVLYSGAATQDVKPGMEIDISISYTIGRYTYDTDTRTMKIQQGVGPELIVETNQGEVHIVPGKETIIPSDADVTGLSQSRILSISYNPLLNSNGQFTFILGLMVDRTEQNNHYIYYKIGDGNGNLIASDRAYVYTDDVSIYVSNVTVEEQDGTYPSLYLTFQE